MKKDGPNVKWEDVLKSDDSEIEKAHKLWLSKLPPQYCANHKKEQLIQETEDSINRVKSVNFDPRYGPPYPELASNHWRFYFIGKCTECNWETRAKASGISTLYSQFSFDNFRCDEKNLDSIVERVKSYAKDSLGFLLLQGGIGTGKTHLAVSILRETSLSFNYVSHSGLIREYRNFHYQRPNTDTEEKEYIPALDEALGIKGPKKPERYELLKESSLLCIDEFGFVNHSQDEALITFEILDYRIQELLPTILVTNNTTEELKDKIDPRLLDRIKQALSVSLEFGSPSKRKSMNPQYLEKASQRGTLVQGWS